MHSCRHHTEPDHTTGGPAPSSVSHSPTSVTQQHSSSSDDTDPPQAPPADFATLLYLPVTSLRMPYDCFTGRGRRINLASPEGAHSPQSTINNKARQQALRSLYKRRASAVYKHKRHRFIAFPRRVRRLPRHDSTRHLGVEPGHNREQGRIIRHQRIVRPSRASIA